MAAVRRGLSVCVAIRSPRVLTGSFTRASNRVNEVAVGVPTYRGGASDVRTFNTVMREIPKRAAIRPLGNPSPANLRISAQSSKMTTFQSSSVHFSTLETDPISSVVDGMNFRRVG